MNATKDSYMDADNPDTNYGAALFLHEGPFYQGGSKQFLYRSIGNFDVSALAGESIVSAQMERNMYELLGTPMAAHVYRCTRASAWTSAGVTWNKYDGVNVWTVAGGDYDGGTPSPVGFDEPAATGLFVVYGLVDFVKDALANRGGVVSVIVLPDGESSGVTHLATWTSKEDGRTWGIRVFYGGPGDPGRRATSGESEMLAGSRGVRPRAGRLGVAERGGVLPRRPLPALMEVLR